jgi:hypothetical protein
LVGVLTFFGCAGKSPPPPPTCDQTCADGVALRALRLAMKSGFNRSLQGNDAGMQDEMTMCLGAGKGRIHGDIETNPDAGTMKVDLTYDLDACLYLSLAKDPTPEKNFSLTMTGSITEKGILSAQPTSTTSLIFHSDAMTFSGTVYDPASDYEQKACPLDFLQDGNNVTGTVCGRKAGFSF